MGEKEDEYRLEKGKFYISLISLLLTISGFIGGFWLTTEKSRALQEFRISRLEQIYSSYEVKFAQIEKRLYDIEKELIVRTKLYQKREE